MDNNHNNVQQHTEDIQNQPSTQQLHPQPPSHPPIPLNEPTNLPNPPPHPSLESRPNPGVTHPPPTTLEPSTNTSPPQRQIYLVYRILHICPAPGYETTSVTDLLSAFSGIESANRFAYREMQEQVRVGARVVYRRDGRMDRAALYKLVRDDVDTYAQIKVTEVACGGVWN